MPLIIVAALLVVTFVIICFSLGLLHRNQKSRAIQHRLQIFSRLGSVNHLCFSSQEVLKDTIIGLDGLRRKLLVLKINRAKSFYSFVIDLNEIKSCSVKKKYRAISHEDVRTKRLEEYLETISLCFQFHNGRFSKEILFYNSATYPAYDLKVLEQKAKDWEVILSKLRTNLKSTA